MTRRKSLRRLSGSALFPNMVDPPNQPIPIGPQRRRNLDSIRLGHFFRVGPQRVACRQTRRYRQDYHALFRNGNPSRLLSSCPSNGGACCVVRVASFGIQTQRHHNELPFLAVRRDTRTMPIMAQQMGPFVPHRLMNKIVGVLIEKLAIETNMVLTQKGLARRFSAQVKTDRRHGHRTAMVRMAFHNSGKNALLQPRLHWGAACTTESNDFR